MLPLFRRHIDGTLAFDELRLVHVAGRSLEGCAKCNSY